MLVWESYDWWSWGIPQSNLLYRDLVACYHHSTTGFRAADSPTRLTQGYAELVRELLD